MSDTAKYATVILLLLAILFAYIKGRSAVSANGQSLAWTQVPLIAVLIVCIGPSVVATLIYLGTKLGLFQAGPSGVRFSSFIYLQPLDFAIMNWGFVVLYVTCRLFPNFGAPRSAMWLSATLMFLLNVPLFFLGPEMVSNARDAGQGIGIVLAVLGMPMWYPGFVDPESSIGQLLCAPLAPVPFAGLIGWIGGQFIGRATSPAERETA
ncbi:hypothetical protein [Bradyrhizobium sp. SYSU BS000235]|uniref:hypothetical protein n=1 Tax=Bradyrhizobium sp. SYSU BS000235 TaxID=3411332 RepID=UPI003C712385